MSIFITSIYQKIFNIINTKYIISEMLDLNMEKTGEILDKNELLIAIQLETITRAHQCEPLLFKTYLRFDESERWLP